MVTRLIAALVSVAVLAAGVVRSQSVELTASALGEQTVSSRCPSQGQVNDDYCDCPDGSDEFNTSACSHLGARFTCTSNGADTVAIPTSRVNDGVCDCCDGSDERNSPFGVVCEDRCTQSLQNLRKEALAYYRNIQSGMRARASIIQRWKAQLDSDRRSYELLLNDRKQLINYLMNLRFFLRLESTKEEAMRFNLIREREDRCGQGIDEACDYFHPGYLTDWELSAYSFQANVLGNSPSAGGKDRSAPSSPYSSSSSASGGSSQKRFIYQHTEEEIAHVSSLHGVKKVQASLCLSPALLPDEGMRIFATVGDYLQFMNSPGGQTHRQHVAKRRRHNENIFNKYFDNGDVGYTHFILAICESLGLALSPVLVALHGLSLIYEWGSYHLWQWILLRNAQYKQATASSSSDIIGRFTQILVDMNDERSSLYRNVMRYLDYRLYALPVYFVDRITPFLSPPLYLWTVLMHTPGLYWKYYFQNEGNKLPERRQACLLRTGIAHAQKEIESINQRIEERETMVALLPLSGEGPSRLRDYGPEQVWASLAHSCLHKIIQNYNYTLCLFRSIQQQPLDDEEGKQSFSLGRFAHWGDQETPFSDEALLWAAQLQRMKETRLHDQQTGDDVWGTKEFVHQLGQIPRYLGQMIFSLWRPQRETVLALREKVDQLQIAIFGSSERETRFSRRTRRGGGAGGATASSPRPLLHKWNTTWTQTVDHLHQAVLLYNLSLSFPSPTASENKKKTEKTGGKTEKTVFSHKRVYYSVQRYEQGTVCLPRSPQVTRSTRVKLTCGGGQEAEIRNVTEKDVCQYEMDVVTPLACTEEMEEEAMERLEQLGVFGFASKSSKT